MAFEKLENLNGQIAVVTGANGGMGRAICKKLSELGATVYGLVRSRDSELQEFLNGLRHGHKAVLCDVLDSMHIHQAVALIPKCDILINTAGKSRVIPHGNLDALGDLEFDDLLKTNLRSVFSVTKAFLPKLYASDYALVINISSASSIRTGGSNLAYAAAKAGVDSLTKNLSVAFAPRVRFIALNPSMVDSGFLPISEDTKSKVAAMTPLKRISTVDDVANAVEAFTTTLRFTTGNCFVIDGGRII